MYQNFIGIDIGKFEFHVAIDDRNKVDVYSNTPEGFEKLYSTEKSILETGLIILETTGGYEMALVRFLQGKGCALHRANTRKVKNFIRSYGQLGKSDNIDAQALSQYGKERHSNLPLFIEHSDKLLLQLIRRRIELKGMLVQEKNRLKAPEQSALISSYEKIRDVIKEEIACIEEKIEEIFKQDDSLNEKREVLKTIPGVGDITATQLLMLMPELGKINRKQIASLGGVAPHPNESGKKVGYRYTRGGRHEVKPVLFMAAMSAARSKSQLGSKYNSFVDNGKKKMVAITAIMRKILVIANAKMRDYYINNHAEVA